MASVENRLIGAVKRLYKTINEWENEADEDKLIFLEKRMRILDFEVRNLLKELNGDVTEK